MPSPVCAVIGCSNSCKKLARWRETICPLHRCPQGSSACTCKPPYYMLMFPKVDEVKLAWEKCVNRTESVTRTVKYNKTTTYHKKGDRWKSSPNDRICTVHFVDGKPTPANPLPTLHLGYTTRKPPLPKRKAPCVRSPLACRKKCRDSVVEADDTCETDADDNTRAQTVISSTTTSSHSSIEAATTCTTPGDDAQREDFKTNLTTSDHTYSLQLCPCGNQCCHDKQILIQQLRKRIAELELIADEHARSKKRSVVHRNVVEVKSNRLDINLYLKNDEQIHFYTGVPTLSHFNLLYDFVYEKVRNMSYWRGKYRVVSQPAYLYKSSPKKSGTRRKLSAKAEFLLTLMKLRLGLLNHDLADRFHVSKTLVSSVFITWVKVLARLLKFLVYWPDKQSVKDNLPQSLAQLYPNIRCTIDCTEFFIERPRNLTLQAQTWSDYKHHNTIKVLVAITPRGSICFVSKAWGGRASDRHITLASGILDFVDPGDQWLADRGFLVKSELLERGAELVVPPAGKGHEQMCRSDVQTTKVVANARIHVERGIERTKRYRFLQHHIVLPHLSIFDDIFMVVAALCNLDSALVK